jgi:hypothetical protein
VPPKYFLGLEVESDRTFEFRIPYKAHPQVTSTWTLLNSNGEEQQLSDGGKYAIQVDDKTVSLRISGCTRADAGEYRILAHNAVGSDSATVKLTVMDKPEAPVQKQYPSNLYLKLMEFTAIPGCRECS